MTRPRNPASHAKTAGALRTRRHASKKKTLPRKAKHRGRA